MKHSTPNKISTLNLVGVLLDRIGVPRLIKRSFPIAD